MANKPIIKDIWVIHYNVLNKNKDYLLRPFIVVSIINNQIYGIPLTSFKEKRYRQEFGDFIFENHFLNTKSIVKPYQIIKIKEDFFKNKIGSVDDEVINKINQSNDLNVINYLSMKNISAIMREYVIERQNQKINLLELKNQSLENEVEKLKEENQLLKQNNELKESEFDYLENLN